MVALTAVVAVVLSGTEAHACATCACSDPALVGAGGARPSEGRVRIGGVARWLSIRVDEPVPSTTRAAQIGLTGDATLLDGLAVDWFFPASVAARAMLQTSAVDVGLADADASLRWVLMSDRPVAPRAYGGVRGGSSIPVSSMGRDPRATRLDAGVWAPHVELFAALVRDAWFISGAAGARMPLAERVGPLDIAQGPAATAALRAQLQPRPDVGVFASVSGEARLPTRVRGKAVSGTGGARVQATAGVSLAVLDDVLFEIGATVPLLQTEPEKLDGMITFSTTFDVGRR